MSYLIGLDIGTSSVKAILMSLDGKVQKVSKGTFCYNKTQDGRVEISAHDYSKVCFDVIKTLATWAKGDVKAVCASSASGNVLILDKENKPVTQIINWQDKRVKDEAMDILPHLDLDAFYRKTGWRFGYKTFPLAQVCYIKKHNPELLSMAGKVCMSTEYLYFLLTGKWGISTSAGTPFFFIDQTTGKYIPEIIECLGLHEDMFPPVMKEGKILGGILPEMAELTGLKAGTPIVLGTFDHPSAARGVGVLKEGKVLLSCGTSWVTLFPIATRERIVNANMLIDPFLSNEGGCWAGMNSVPSISNRINLYVNRYIDNSPQSFEILSILARRGETGAGGLKINPFDEPDDNKILKYSLNNIARAIMEGTVQLLKNNIDALKENGIYAKEGIMVGGPSEDPYWIELIENICNIKLKVIHGQYAGAVGAAKMAGVAVGIYENIESVDDLCV